MSVDCRWLFNDAAVDDSRLVSYERCGSQDAGLASAVRAGALLAGNLLLGQDEATAMEIHVAAGRDTAAAGTSDDDQMAEVLKRMLADARSLKRKPHRGRAGRGEFCSRTESSCLKNPLWRSLFKINPKFYSQRGKTAFSSGCLSVDFHSGTLTHSRAEGSPCPAAAGRRTGVS